MGISRLLTLLAVGAVVLAAAGAALAATGDPKKEIKPADQALARAAVVTKADLGPGWAVDTSTDNTPDPDADCPGYAPDESQLTLTGDADGKELTYSKGRTYLFVGSGAQVYKSVAQANESWRMNAKPGLWSCLGKNFEALTDAKTIFRVRSAHQTAIPAAAAARRLAGRIVFDVSYKSTGRTARFYVDVIILQTGRIQSTVFVMSIGAPAAASDRTALIGIVAAKLRAEVKRDDTPSRIA